MTDASLDLPAPEQAARMERYYRIHARIYDATRWSFLFGRASILSRLPILCVPARILEVGCGTGHNLRLLRKRFPDAQITGVDVSATMLAKARDNLGPLVGGGGIRLHHGPYRMQIGGQPFDLILFSYCLSMVNPGWEQLLDFAKEDLSQDGRIAVVDFHDSPFPLFRRWMGVSHVRMEGHLLPGLQARFATETCEVRNAYAGAWSYVQWVGTAGLRRDR
jgi:S-adenosylmethionine-diacylgycerolhomoserine-N-methlytransferase